MKQVYYGSIVKEKYLYMFDRKFRIWDDIEAQETKGENTNPEKCFTIWTVPHESEIVKEKSSNIVHQKGDKLTIDGKEVYINSVNYDVDKDQYNYYTTYIVRTIKITAKEKQEALDEHVSTNKILLEEYYKRNEKPKKKWYQF